MTNAAAPQRQPHSLQARRQLADVDASRAADALETLALVARRLEGAHAAGGPLL